VDVWPTVILGETDMEQRGTTDPGRARQTACPAWLRKRMRRNLVRASLNRTDKPRAQQALRLLTDQASHTTVAVVPGQRTTDSVPNTPDAPSVPIATARPARDVSAGAKRTSIGPAFGQQRRLSRPRSAGDTHGPAPVPVAGGNSGHRFGRAGESRSTELG
jgi:hypothetical protein